MLTSPRPAPVLPRRFSAPLLRLGSLLTLLTLLTVCGPLAACGSEDPTALRLRLISDPVLNTEAQVAAQLSQLELVLSASGGFANVPAGATRVGAFEVSDSDRDGRAELLWRRALSAASDLPELRLTPGANGTRTLAVSAFGRQGGTVVAAGSVSSITFTAGSEHDVEIPFNLHAAFRPPRVVLSSPHDGQVVPPALSQVVVEFSRTVLLGSATTGNGTASSDGLRLLYESGSNRLVSGAWTLSTTTVQEAGTQHKRSLATLAVPCKLNGGTYRLEATSAIVDSSGQHLDQQAANDALDPFVARFSIPGAAPPSGEPCAGTVEYCKSDEGCQPKEQFYCAFQQGSTEGKCVPRTGNCGVIQCEKGLVCLASDAVAQCIPDCRLYGCNGKGLCNGQTGVCEPCPSTPGDPNCAPPPPPDDCKLKCTDLCSNKDQAACDDCIKQACPNTQP